MSGPIDLICAAPAQSNGVARGDSALSIAANPALCKEWRGSSLLNVADPVGSGSSTANTGSQWPALLQSLTTYSERPAAFVGTGVGGTPLLPASTSGSNHWGPGGSPRATAITRMSNARAGLVALGYEPVLHSVVVIGETDAASYPNQSTLEADFKAALIEFRDTFRDELDDPALDFFIMRLGTRPGFETGCAKIRAAQDDVCSTEEGFTMIYTEAVAFPERGWMKSDQLHWTQAGLNDAGTKGGMAVAAALGFDTPGLELDRTRTSDMARRLRLLD